MISAEQFTTRHVSPSDLEELLEGGGAPAVSIYLPTHRPNDQADADRIRFRSSLERAGGSGKTESDVANLSHLAAQGRLRLLMVGKGRPVWGRRDPETGDVEFAREGGEDPGAEGVEVLDALARSVLRHGGTVLPLSTERMPVESGAAGVLW